MSYQVKSEKVINRPAGEVFRALKEGRLFMNCSADSGTMKIDFRVGGDYHIDFKSHRVSNWGKFIEIVPDKKIVFSWCQTFGADQQPDTEVTIELFPDGTKTRLTLLHTGFKTKDLADQHQGGWDGGINDFSEEVQEGTLRMVRHYPVSVEKLFAAVQGQVKGEVTELVPNKKLKLEISQSQATLSFHKKEDGSSKVEILHNMAHRAGWESVTEKLTSSLAKS